MPGRRSLTFAVGVAAAVITLIGPAVAAAHPSPVIEDGKYCATTLAKGKPGEVSRIVNRHCSDVSAEARSAISASSSWLGQVSEHEYQGGEYEMFFGDSGPCDAEGYRVDWVRQGMQNKTSSFMGMSNCNYVSLYDNSHCNPDAGYFGLANAGGAGIIVDTLPAFNDRTSSLRFQRL